MPFGGQLLRDQRGVALPLAMLSLVVLSVMIVAFVSMASMEPQVSANLVDTTRARYVAEAGVDWAFDTLVNPAVTWTTALANAAATGDCNADGCRLGAVNQTLPGLTAVDGTYTVRIRNDNLAGDQARTGLAGPDTGGANNDTNGRLFITASGTLNGTTRRIQVVMRRVVVPNFPGALNLPGFQADALWQGTDRFRIDGRDYRNSTIDAFAVNNAGGCAGSNSCGAVEGTPTGAGAAKFGIGVQPGNQSNIAGNPTYEAHVESALNTANKRARVKGKDETAPANITTGYNTVQADASLTPNIMSDFVKTLSGLPVTQIFQSTQACPMRADATGTPNVVRLRNNGGSVSSSNSPSGSCPMDQTLNFGTLADPKVVYFRGDPDPGSTFPGLTMNGTIKGAGLLIVEDGDFRQNGNFTWDGLVIVTGQYVSIGMYSGSTTHIAGAMTALESRAGEAGGFFEFLAGINGDINSAAFRNSTTNIQMVANLLLGRQFHSLSSWREF